MAHLITGYAGHEHIQSSDEGAFNAAFFGNEQYVLESGKGNHFAASIIDNNTVRILDGEGLMYGRHFRIEPGNYEDVTIKTGVAGKKRIDLICATYEKKLDDETESVYLQVIKGDETTGTAIVPTYTDGNILEGAIFNQMPLYKVVIENISITKIEPVFKTLPSYQRLAQIYEERFELACEELKTMFDINNVIKKADVVDNLLSESTIFPLSARQGKILGDKANIAEDSLNNLSDKIEKKNYLKLSTQIGSFFSDFSARKEQGISFFQVAGYATSPNGQTGQGRYLDTPFADGTWFSGLLIDIMLDEDGRWRQQCFINYTGSLYYRKSRSDGSGGFDPWNSNN